MAFDFDLALQVFAKLKKKERAAVLRALTVLVSSIGFKRDKNGRTKEISGLLAVYAKDVTVQEMLDKDYLQVTIIVPRQNLYGMTIGEGSQGQLSLKQVEANFDAPTVRKPRNIL